MAIMRPELSEDDLRQVESRAEVKAYRAIRDQLSNDALAIHSAKWLYRNRAGEVVQGEADFTIFFKESGFLTVEVKGGGIALDGKTGSWSSIDRNGSQHRIKDPFRQAQREQYAILDQLRGHPEWRRWPGKRLLCGHAVLFPDLDDPTPLAGPGRPREIIGMRGDMERIEAWIAQVLRFWTGLEPTQPAGQLGLELAEKIFCGSIEVRPPLGAELEREEEIRIRLTDQQARVLRVIGGRPRAIIGGGAGTGKTLIAVEKARRLATSGQKTLLLCYNRPLADALRGNNRDVSSLEIMSYHQLCDQRISNASRQSGRNVLAEAKEAFPGADLFDTQMPFALALANEILDEKYDAVIVDEAQDFSDEYWMGVEELLRNREHGIFYLFIDPNQALYKRQGNLPIKDEPFYLTANCRNTTYIHEAAYRYYEGDPIDPPEIVGAPITKFSAETVEEQANTIAKEIGRLTQEEKVRATDIAVLVMGRPKQEYYKILSARKLAGKVIWAVEVAGDGSVVMDTVARFKGLEAAIVFLWLPPIIDDESDREMLYVGLSRGKARLYLVGHAKSCAAAVAVN